jgi:hypothetical protein
MNHSVKKCGGDFCVGEDVVPPGKFKICRDYERLSLVTLRNDLKQQFRALKPALQAAIPVAIARCDFALIFFARSTNSLPKCSLLQTKTSCSSNVFTP